MATLRLLCVVAGAALLAGCFNPGDGDDAAGTPDGSWVNYRWGDSARSCVNGTCSYGQNAKSFSVELECRVVPTLEWDASSWVHGTIAVTVLDDAGAEGARFTLSRNGHGFVPVTGEPGTWTFKGLTNDANGSAEIRLTCK